MRFNFKILVLFTTISILFLINGCKEESNPVTPPSEHMDIEGWVIRDATSKPILVVWQGVIQSLWNGVRMSDTLYAPENSMTDHYSIKFLNDDKEMFNPPTSSDYSFGFNIADTSVLGIYQHSSTEYEFHLKGKKEGKTTLELVINHLGHVDARTPKIPVIVREDSTSHGEPVAIKVSIESSGAELATATTTSSSGVIEVNKDATTSHLKVEFLDDHGHTFQPSFPAHTLAGVGTPSGSFEFLLEENEPWVFSLKGLTVGNANLVLKLMVNGTSEFTSFPINIKVN